MNLKSQSVISISTVGGNAVPSYNMDISANFNDIPIPFQLNKPLMFITHAPHKVRQCTKCTYLQPLYNTL